MKPVTSIITKSQAQALISVNKEVCVCCNSKTDQFCFVDRHGIPEELNQNEWVPISYSVPQQVPSRESLPSGSITNVDDLVAVYHYNETQINPGDLNRKSRFVPGETYHFFRVCIECNGNTFWTTQCGVNDKIIDQEIITVICESEHRVPSDFDEEKKYFGYRFVDYEGNVYDNQYPTASYGQMSDAQDRIVSRFVIEDGKIVECFDYILLTQVLSDIEDALNVNSRRFMEDIGSLQTTLDFATDWLHDHGYNYKSIPVLPGLGVDDIRKCAIYRIGMENKVDGSIEHRYANYSTVSLDQLGTLHFDLPAMHSVRKRISTHLNALMFEKLADQDMRTVRNALLSLNQGVNKAFAEFENEVLICVGKFHSRVSDLREQTGEDNE